MAKLMLIDGDILVYRMLAAATQTLYRVLDNSGNVLATVESGRIEGKTGPQRAEEAKDALLGEQVVKDTIEPPIDHVGQLIKQFLADVEDVYRCDRRIYLSANRTFRNEIYPEYKAHRPPRPPMVPEVREMLCNSFGALVSERYEADDELSILARTNPSTVIVSIDKDFHQVPGVFYNPFTKKEYVIDNVSAEYSLWIQVVAGDSVDNIKGIPNFSTKKAKKYVEQFENPDDVPFGVAALYADSGLTLQDMVLNYRLVKLLSHYGEENEPPDWLEDCKDAFS